MRLPPTVDGEEATLKIKETLEANPPQNAHVSFEADHAASLCEHKVHTLLALERELTGEGVVERFKVIRPSRARDHARIWQLVPESEEPGD